MSIYSRGICVERSGKFKSWGKANHGTAMCVNYSRGICVERSGKFKSWGKVGVDRREGGGSSFETKCFCV